MLDEEDLLNEIASLFEKAEVEKTGTDVINLGELTDKDISYFHTKIGKKFTNFKKVIEFSAFRHIAITHGEEYERLSHQEKITVEHVINIPNVINNHDSMEFQPKDHTKGKYNDALLFIKGDYTVVLEIVFGKRKLRLKTMWVKK